MGMVSSVRRNAFSVIQKLELRRSKQNILPVLPAGMDDVIRADTQGCQVIIILHVRGVIQILEVLILLGTRHLWTIVGQRND